MQSKQLKALICLVFFILPPLLSIKKAKPPFNRQLGFMIKTVRIFPTSPLRVGLLRLVFTEKYYLNLLYSKILFDTFNGKNKSRMRSGARSHKIAQIYQYSHKAGQYS